MISEAKLDHTFPEAQFYIEGFRTSFKLDCNKDGGGTGHSIPNDIKSFFIETKVNTCKWLVSCCCSYNPNGINVSTHLEQIRKALDIYSKK